MPLPENANVGLLDDDEHLFDSVASLGRDNHGGDRDDPMP